MKIRKPIYTDEDLQPEPDTPPPFMISRDPADHLPEMYPWTFDEGRLEWWVLGSYLAILAAVSIVIYILINRY